MVDPPKVVTNSSTNRARRSLTSLMWRTPLPLSQTGHLNCGVKLYLVSAFVTVVYIVATTSSASSTSRVNRPSLGIENVRHVSVAEERSAAEESDQQPVNLSVWTQRVLVRRIDSCVAEYASWLILPSILFGGFVGIFRFGVFCQNFWGAKMLRSTSWGLGLWRGWVEFYAPPDTISEAEFYSKRGCTSFSTGEGKSHEYWIGGLDKFVGPFQVDFIQDVFRKFLVRVAGHFSGGGGALQCQNSMNWRLGLQGWVYHFQYEESCSPHCKGYA